MIKTSPHLPKYNIIKSVHILYIQKQPEALYLFPHKLAGTWWISKAVEDSPKIMMCAIHSVHSLSLNIMSTSMQQNQFPCWPYRLSPTWWLHSCRWVIWSDHNIIHCHLCISLNIERGHMMECHLYIPFCCLFPWPRMSASLELSDIMPCVGHWLSWWFRQKW